jgi:hypothetical protein
MGPRIHQLLATLCVASSLALFALADPSAIMELILDIVVVSHNVEGASYEESRWHANSFLLHLFTVSAKTCCFASSVVTPRGYKADDCSCVQPMSSHMISHHLPAFFPEAEKKER